ncbi:MAG: hypothetical protein SPL10_02810 [Synergistales bacterium]|nr:hypothetical protein [Synergistales bacterium]MDY6401998.1 hypothetical protein [Synergistales bacterium]MDY6405169.1 hypothetical protein [Synergistales bacterium]MDY6409696.1 hypothetical protein [Synergistales bacterium]MDY6414072.1 hypothetical protein [Synergistales bacterium]
MSTLTAEKKFTTGNEVLDYYDDNDESWADLLSTPDEEAQIAESDEDFKKGEYLTLEEFMKGL